MDRMEKTMIKNAYINELVSDIEIDTAKQRIVEALKQGGDCVSIIASCEQTLEWLKYREIKFSPIRGQENLYIVYLDE